MSGIPFDPDPMVLYLFNFYEFELLFIKCLLAIELCLLNPPVILNEPSELCGFTLLELYLSWIPVNDLFICYAWA